MVDILLADDHELIRKGARSLLESEPGFRVVGEVASGLEVVPAVERLKPHVLILDVKMPGLNGLDAAREALARAPTTRVVMLSMHSDEELVIRALAAGALAYVLKASGAVDVVQAVKEALAGRHYLSPPLSEKSIESWMQRVKSNRFDGYDTLSPRERQVLQLAAEGLSNPEISQKLGISPRTVETHRANLMKKLSIKGQTDLVRFALKHGVVDS